MTISTFKWLNNTLEDFKSARDNNFKEELTFMLKALVEEVSELRCEVNSLQRQIDDHNMYKH